MTVLNLIIFLSAFMYGWWGAKSVKYIYNNKGFKYNSKSDDLWAFFFPFTTVIILIVVLIYFITSTAILSYKLF